MFQNCPSLWGRGCLAKEENENIHYDFGPSSRTESKEELLAIGEEGLRHRLHKDKKSTKRRDVEFMPDKSCRWKRRPSTSTLKKIKQIRSAKWASKATAAALVTTAADNNEIIDDQEDVMIPSADILESHCLDETRIVFMNVLILTNKADRRKWSWCTRHFLN